MGLRVCPSLSLPPCYGAHWLVCSIPCLKATQPKKPAAHMVALPRLPLTFLTAWRSIPCLKTTQSKTRRPCSCSSQIASQLPHCMVQVMMKCLWCCTGAFKDGVSPADLDPEALNSAPSLNTWGPGSSCTRHNPAGSVVIDLATSSSSGLGNFVYCCFSPLFIVYELRPCCPFQLCFSLVT